MQLSKLDWYYVQERAAHFTGRGWVFARLDQFLRQPPGAFLLLGEPGAGKTAIAAQLALAAAGRLTAAAAAAPHRAVPIAAAYFCRAGSVDLLDIAQRLSDQLAEAVPSFAHARQATLLPEIRVGDVQVRTGDIASGGSATGVHIDLSRLEAETAFVRAVTLPLKRVRETGEMTRIMLLVDALDESLASKAAEALPRLLGDVEYAHLLVTARPDHRATGGLRERAECIDLLADAPPGIDDVLEYLQRRLASEGAPAAMAVLSRRIAEQASGNFLYAFYVVEALRRDNVLTALDSAAARGVPLPGGGLPGVYRSFLRRELWRDDRAWLTRFGPVLAPLALAQDEGLTTEQLRLIAGRLSGEPVTRTAVRDVTRAARQFLEGPAPDGPVRVYHQSFANFLVDPEQNPDFLIDAAEVHNAIVETYSATSPLSWDTYARRNLALHATKAGRLDHLLEDVRFLLVAEPGRLVPHLDAVRSAPARATAAVYRQTVHTLAGLDPTGRASQLELTARRLDRRSLADRIAAAAPGRPWQTHWSHGRQATGYQVLTGHTGRVSAVAVGALADGTPVIVSGGDDGTVRLWRLADGAPAGKPLHGTDYGGVHAVAAGALPDGTPVIVSGGTDGTVRLWRTDGTPLLEPLHHGGRYGGVHAVAVGALADGTPVIISGGSDDGTVRLWRLADGAPAGSLYYGKVVDTAEVRFDVLDGAEVERPRRYVEAVHAVAVGALADGTPVILGGGDSTSWVRRGGTVQVWRTDGTRLLEPLHHGGRYGRVHAVAVGALADGTPVIVSGGSDKGTVRLWRLADGAPARKPLHGTDYGGVHAVAAGALPDGTPVIVSGGTDGTVRLWRTDGTPLRKPLHHGGVVTAVAVGALADGTPVIVSGGTDGTVRLWRLANGDTAGKPPHGTDGVVAAVAVRALADGTPVIVSGGTDGTVRLWRTDGTPLRKPLHHGGVVTAVAVGALADGTPVIVSGGTDGTVRLWRTDGTPLRKPLHHGGVVTAVAVGALADGTPVIVSGCRVGTVRLWRLADGTPAGEPLHGTEYGGKVEALAVRSLPDGTQVIVSHIRSLMRAVRVWRLPGGALVELPLSIYTGGEVDAVAAGALPDGTPVIVSGCRDDTVWVWRLADGTPVGKPLRGHGDWVCAVAVGALADGTPVIVSGGSDLDGTVRLWRLADGTPLVPPLHLSKKVRSIAIHGNVIITAAGTDLAVHQPALPWHMP